MLLNSLGRRRIWGLENYNIKAYRACHVDEQPYSLTGPGDPWKGESHDLWWHGGGQGQALCQTQAVRQVKPHPRPRPPLVLTCTRQEPNFTPDSYIATSSTGIHQKSGQWDVDGCSSAQGTEGDGRRGQYGRQKGACQLLARGGVSEGKAQDERPCRQPVPPGPGHWPGKARGGATLIC